MDTMNRTTMRYPKLEQMITAAEFMLECETDKIAPGSEAAIEQDLAKMKSLDSQIKAIPYQSGSDAKDAANERMYDKLEQKANVLIRAVSNLLWPRPEPAVQ